MNQRWLIWGFGYFHGSVLQALSVKGLGTDSPKKLMEYISNAKKDGMTHPLFIKLNWIRLNDMIKVHDTNIVDLLNLDRFEYYSTFNNPQNFRVTLDTTAFPRLKGLFADRRS